MKTILAIDQGTTSTTAVIINAQTFQYVAKVSHEFPQIFPKPGWVEHDLNDIWKSVEQSVLSLIKGHNIDSAQIQSIGITNQRETTCAFDKSGTPLHNAIVWQDRRTRQFCESMKNKNDFFKKKTGLPLDPYFSATKMHWLLSNSDKVKKAYDKSTLHLGTMDTFLLYKLTNGNSYYTEASNASRTLLMNLKDCDWGQELLDIFGISKSILPIIKDSWGDFGKTKGLHFLPDGIPITGILGDQQAALFGQAGHRKGSMKCTYGTGAFLLLNIGEDIRYSQNGLITTVAFKNKNKKIYALEGVSYIAGAAVQWLRDNLNIIEFASESETNARKINDLEQMKYLLFLPFFSGIGSPHWMSQAKAAIIGITRDTNRYHLCRACLDGICFSINDLISAMKKDSQLNITDLKIDGGAVNNNLLCEIQATISSLEIIRPKVIETTAYGVALASAIGNNQMSIDQIDKLWKQDRIFVPNSDEISFYNEKLKQWNQAIKNLYY